MNKDLLFGITIFVSATLAIVAATAINKKLLGF